MMPKGMRGSCAGPRTGPSPFCCRQQNLPRRSSPAEPGLFPTDRLLCFFNYARKAFPEVFLNPSRENKTAGSGFLGSAAIPRCPNRGAGVGIAGWPWWGALGGFGGQPASGGTR